jgi:sugar phosphate isomerase/epimerase
MYATGMVACQKSKQAGIPVGVQLWCVRKECREDLPGTCAHIAEMGYTGVEFAGYYGYSAAELRKILVDNGLSCCGTHIKIDTLLGDELQKSIEFNRTLGNPYLIVSGLNEKVYATKEKWLQAAEMFNRIAETLQPHRLRVGYHNHLNEFKAVDGQMPWDILADNTRKDVILQLDTATCCQSGADPLFYLRRHPGRSATTHLSPYSAVNEKALLGEDDIDWKQALDLYKTIAGTEWYIVEYWSEGVPALDALKRNLDNLRKLEIAASQPG